MGEDSASAFPYHEPGIATILILSSILLLLNITNLLLDKLIFCGLLGQVFLGMAWGTPSSKWLGTTTEEVMAQLGYLGLILLVYEGGLSTSFTALKAHIGLSMVVATTGVVMPIGISFCLKSLVSASPLQAFAAGVALCSTSLGTTLTTLSTSGVSKTPLGTVITGAAMLDDIAGLVLVQVVSNLSASRATISAATILRPILVSLGFVVVVVLGCKYVISPLTQQLRGRASPARPFAKLARNLPSDSIAFCFHTTTLFALVVSATYAGTSPLFAAYVVGATISWWDEKFSPDSRKEDHDAHGPPSEVPEQSNRVGNTSMTTSTDITSPDSTSELSTADIQNSILSNDTATRTENSGVSVQDETSTGVSVYERYYLAVVERILKPFFFASIGFAIPITEMFEGSIVWRGLVYGLLMAVAKIITGAWLIRLNIKLSSPSSLPFHQPSARAWRQGSNSANKFAKSRSTRSNAASQAQPDYGTANSSSVRWTDPEEVPPHPSDSGPSRLRTLYPASITGLAMIARGEIGFLIASLAESQNIFPETGPDGTGTSRLYLVVVWAIMLCTIAGPLSLGALVRRVKRLQTAREMMDDFDPLDGWGTL